MSPSVELDMIDRLAAASSNDLTRSLTEGEEVLDSGLVRGMMMGRLGVCPAELCGRVPDCDRDRGEGRFPRER